MNLKQVTYLIIFLAVTYVSAQESNAVVALSLPVRNSLMFNRHLINPTFSFVREQHKYISIYNKREFIQFEDAPVTYLANYSGRFGENTGAGLSLFQQNFGVLTTFGGVLNYAYNARIQRDNNLTFGLNIGAYSSGINTGSVTTNFSDPSIQNAPNNFMLTINPGINYGTVFFDFGISATNLALYNFESSTLETDIPNQGIQGHMMYTGYISSRGFFDDSKFTGLIRSEFRKDETIVAANAMLTIPKGLWIQGGYNSSFGASGGIGLNITQDIALEYNYEMAFGEINPFGPSHEITLAYRFKSNKYYDYSRQDKVSGLISNKKPRVIKRNKSKSFKNPVKITTTRDPNTDKDRLADSIPEKPIAENKANTSEKVDDITTETIEAQTTLRDTIPYETPKNSEVREIVTDSTSKSTAVANSIDNDSLVSKLANEKNKEITALINLIETSRTLQNQLLDDYNKTIDSKDETLKYMKEENDLSEQGIPVKPRPFKSITAENDALQSIKTELERISLVKDKNIKRLNELYDNLYEADTIVNEVVMLFYKKKIKAIETKQKEVVELTQQLETRLDSINIGIEFEKRRRIKRAEFDNEEERYNQDRATLENLKETITVTGMDYSEDDFDYGFEGSNNIQILKNVNYAESGYYLILAVHDNISRRNEFIKKVIESGELDIDFFYDVNTSKYYIYVKKFPDIQQANNLINTRSSKPYNKNLSIVKIEN